MLWESRNSTTALRHRDSRQLGIALLGLVGVIIVVALVSLLMAVPFMVRRDVLPGAFVQLGDLRTVSNVVTRADGTYLLTLQFTDRGGSAIDPQMLNVELAMDGHPMEPQPVPLQRTAAGEYLAEGLLTMIGRWRFSVTSEAGTMNVVADRALSF